MHVIISKESDHVQSILNQINRGGQNVKEYLEWKDMSGQTALLIASYRGYYAVVDLVIVYAVYITNIACPQLPCLP